MIRNLLYSIVAGACVVAIILLSAFFFGGMVGYPPPNSCIPILGGATLAAFFGPLVVMVFDKVFAKHIHRGTAPRPAQDPNSDFEYESFRVDDQTYTFLLPVG